VGVNQKDINQKKCAYKNNGVDRGSVIELSQPKEVKSKVRGRKLRSGVYWQAALKQKAVKQVESKIRATHISGTLLFHGSAQSNMELLYLVPLFVRSSLSDWAHLRKCCT
jgi:hypothetical protein